jgi:hypothetical protein
MPLREIHSRCRSHLLVLDGPSEIDLQFPIQLLNSLVLLACVARDGIGGAEAVQNRAANPMPGVTLQLHALARVKFGDGIHQSQNAVGAQLIHFHMGREMFANFKSHTPYQRKHFNQHLLPVDVAIEFPFPTPSPSPDGRFPCDDAVTGRNTARLFHCCLLGFDFFSHGFFSLSAAFFSGHDSRVRHARHARGLLFVGETKTSLFNLFIGEPQSRGVSLWRQTGRV